MRDYCFQWRAGPIWQHPAAKWHARLFAGGPACLRAGSLYTGLHSRKQWQTHDFIFGGVYLKKGRWKAWKKAKVKAKSINYEKVQKFHICIMHTTFQLFCCKCHWKASLLPYLPSNASSLPLPPTRLFAPLTPPPPPLPVNAIEVFLLARHLLVQRVSRFLFQMEQLQHFSCLVRFSLASLRRYFFNPIIFPLLS